MQYQGGTKLCNKQLQLTSSSQSLTLLFFSLLAKDLALGRQWVYEQMHDLLCKYAPSTAVSDASFSIWNGLVKSAEQEQDGCIMQCTGST